MRPIPVLTTLLALCTLSGVSTEAQADAPGATPTEAMVVRNSCFRGVEQDRRMNFGGGSGRGSGGMMPSASAPAAPPPPMPASKPRTKLAKQAESAPAISAGDAAAGVSVAEPSPMRDMADDDMEREEQIIELPVGSQTGGPRVDWGGVVHLSNDDSMSLASAQRVLYAVDNGMSPALSEIRPHELLNYFSFATPTPKTSDVFAVDASAVQVDDDTMSLALTVQGAVPERPKADLTFLVDRSGSMSADGRMEYTKRGLHLAVDRLQDGDRVDLVLFDNDVCTPVENFVAGRDDRELLHATIDKMQPRGSTDLNRGLAEAYRIARSHTDRRDRAHRVMVLTDALLNTGDVNPHTVSDIGRALEQHDIRLTGVGVGRTFNDDVLNKLTEKGKGAYVFLGSEAVVDRIFGQGFEALVQTIAHDVRFSMDLPPSLGMERFYGEESSAHAEDIQPIHYYAGTSQVFLQDLAIKPGALRDRDQVDLKIAWTDVLDGSHRERTFSWRVGDALAASQHNVRKAKSLMAFSDVLYANALGGDPCAQPLADWQSWTAGEMRGDAELAWVDGLIGRYCDTDRVALGASQAPTKVRLDADVAISRVDLSCGGVTEGKAMAAATVASFTTRPGTCDLTLHGAVPMRTTVEVPPSGADLRCVVRGGRVSCS